jgi:hypothetical protein
MFRASRCRQRPSVVRAGRLGLLPKVAGVGAGLVQLWPGPGSGDLGDHAGVRLGALSARPSRRHALDCVASTGIAAELGGKRTSESGRTEACEVAALATHGRGTAPPARRPQLLAGQPIIAATLVQVGQLDQACKLCADTPGSILSDGWN